jgi:chemotaxis protein MotB
MRTRSVRLLSFLPAALAVAVALGGCANDQAKRRAALLEQEANELRARNSQLESALSASNEERARLEQEALLAERDALLANQNLNRSAANTGFEGIEGVGSTRGPGGDVIVDIVGDVLFDSGKVTLKSTAKTTLDRVAGVINSSYSGKAIRVEGHTDSDPIKKSQWKSNERLSAERALAVEEYLTSKGVDKARMYIAGFGDAKPRGSKSQSRRVEIVILAN